LLLWGLLLAVAAAVTRLTEIYGLTTIKYYMHSIEKSQKYSKNGFSLPIL